jgi:4-amino-4-deoxychorismate lyase
MSKVLINGISSGYVSVSDRGLHYGDGVFETIACIGDHPVFIQQHLDRMESGARKLNIHFPDRQLFLDDINCLLRGSNSNSIIKLILTRGRGKRGYRYETTQIPTRIGMLSAWPDYVAHWREQGIATRFCQTQVSTNPQLAGIKSLNRLDSVLASSELGQAFNEGFLSDIDGNVIEGTMSNIFTVLNDVLVTPDLTRCGVNGIMRDQIIDIAHNNNIKVEMRNISPDELLESREIFISNSVIGACVVKQLEQQFYSIDTMTRTINKILDKRIEADAKAAA